MVIYLVFLLEELFAANIISFFQINKQNLVFTCLIGEAKLKSVPGVVTSYSGDYGWTESLLSFNADVVTCGELWVFGKQLLLM